MGRFKDGVISMRLGSWVFLKSKDLKVDCFYPYTKRGKNKVFEPYITFTSPSGYLYLYGKRNMWSLLDSLFPNDPLPRNPVNADLKDAEQGKVIINELLQDPDAWEDLRLQVRQGERYDPFGRSKGGLRPSNESDVTFIMSASSASSEVDITPNLVLLENQFKTAYCMPFTITTKTNMKTIPALFIPLDSAQNYKVVVTDEIGGEHLIFSIIENAGCNFRPKAASRFNSSQITNIQNEISERIVMLKSILKINYSFSLMRPLDAGMKWYEMDYLEHRRFASCPMYSDWRVKYAN